MAERYPDDASLLAMNEDAATGVEYIPTGRSPYFLEFRRLVQRTLLAAGRANDLRVYQDGDLTIGVRPGRCFIGGSSVSWAGAANVVVSSNATTHVWLNSAGVVQAGVGGFPADRTAFVPLAEVVAGASVITGITDLRGEAFLQIPDLGSMGLAATATEINQALAGVDATVNAAALNRLTNGPGSTADTEHRHLQVFQDQNGDAFFTLINNSGGGSANVALLLSLPNRLADDTWLMPNTANGFLSQRFGANTYNLVGTVHVSFGHAGALTTSQLGKLMGVVPIDGVVSNVILSLGTNIQSSVSADSVSAVVKVNNVVLTTTDPKISSAAGAGFRSTSRGDGVGAVVKSDGTQNVQRGDVLTVDLTRVAAGTVSTEALNVVALVVVRAGQPE